MVNVTEVWKPVIGHEGKYEVSDQGRVKVLAHTVRHWCGRRIPKPERIITLTKHTGGYRMVVLGGGKKHFVHRLVMAAFVGPASPGRDVNHINGDKTDNRLCNLEYCDRLHNVRHAIATGLQDNAGESNGMNKYSAESIRSAHAMVAAGSTLIEASRATGVAASTIEMVAAGKRWKCLGLPVLTQPDDWLKPAGG
jgi:hypothetical protein